MIIANLVSKTISSNSNEAQSLYSSSSIGEPSEDKINYSIYEAFYLFEKGKVKILQKQKEMKKEELLKILQKIDKKFPAKYAVFKNLKNRGYVVKTALKFGADFRVYDKGKKPREVHAKWLIFVNYESEKNSWQDFSAKNRVAHSTNKKLLLAIVDEEFDVLYYEVSWIKP